MLADLHLHSVYSDGWYAPEEICRRAKERGVSALSITDHDTLTGEEDKRAAAKKYGLAYVTGWEISAYTDGQKLHVLGYGCEIGGAYQRFTKERTETALLRAEDSVKKLQAAGVTVDVEEVLAERRRENAPVHTMHIARAVAKKTGLSESDAYLRYLAIGRVGHSDVGRPSPEEAIDCIHADGGVAVIAHPGRIDLPFDVREGLIKRLIDYGADGIEGVYTTHTKRETEYFKTLAARWGAFVTGGSDTHVEDETHVIGLPKFILTDDLSERLKIRK